MTMYVTAGDNKGTKKLSARFGGETAWRQHSGDDRGLSAAYKTRCAELAGQDALAEYELLRESGEVFFDAPAILGVVDCCQCSGQPRPYNGSLSADGVTLVYRRGKLIAAHCG